jgi:hypothetical protein
MIKQSEVNFDIFDSFKFNLFVRELVLELLAGPWRKTGSRMILSKMRLYVITMTASGRKKVMHETNI